MVCVHYGQPASTCTKDVKSMRTGCYSIFNLTKRGAVLVPTKPHMAYNHEVNAKKFVHYRTNFWLDGEDMEQAKVMLVRVRTFKHAWDVDSGFIVSVPERLIPDSSALLLR